MTPEAFVCSATRQGAVPFVPEITLRMAGEPFSLWERTEEGRGEDGLPPPFWAFPWAGGQGLARYVLDNPGTVAGRGVLDLASGSGLVAIAAAKAGAARVTATDIDPLALAAVRINAAANRVVITAREYDVREGGRLEGEGGRLEGEGGRLEGEGGGEAPDVVLAADAFYERDLAEHALAFLRHAQAAGAHVMLADPGRAFLPRAELTAIAEYEIPVVRALEDADTKRVTVYELRC